MPEATSQKQKLALIYLADGDLERVTYKTIEIDQDVINLRTFPDKGYLLSLNNPNIVFVQLDIEQDSLSFTNIVDAQNWCDQHIAVKSFYDMGYIEVQPDGKIYTYVGMSWNHDMFMEAHGKYITHIKVYRGDNPQWVERRLSQDPSK